MRKDVKAIYTTYMVPWYKSIVHIYIYILIYLYMYHGLLIFYCEYDYHSMELIDQ